MAGKRLLKKIPVVSQKKLRPRKRKPEAVAAGAGTCTSVPSLSCNRENFVDSMGRNWWFCFLSVRILNRNREEFVDSMGRNGWLRFPPPLGLYIIKEVTEKKKSSRGTANGMQLASNIVPGPAA